MPTCALCQLAPFEGDNLRSVRIMPGQPHFDALREALGEPEDQSSITVPVCFDCCRENSVEYFGLPPAALGNRPSWPKSRECPVCHLPFRQGERATGCRFFPTDPQWEAVGEEGQPAVAVYVCGGCADDFWPIYAERVGKDATIHGRPGQML